MLEEILKDISNTLKEIADSLKGNVIKSPDKNEITIMPTENKAPQLISSQVVNTVQQVPIPNPVAVPQVQVPVNTQPDSFTQEQIAVAMSNAMAAGKQDLVQNILKTFNAQCLMQIDSGNYNKIATMLREAGIQI